MLLAWYIRTSARCTSSAARTFAAPRRSDTGPSRRQTTPTSTLTGLAASRGIFPGPVVALDRLLEALGNLGGFDAARQMWNQEAELVAAESRVEIARLADALERQHVFRADLIREDLRYPLDDAVANGMSEGVVVALEAGNVDDADAAPTHALLDGEERFEPLHEPVEIEQLGLWIAMRLFGQLGDDFLEVARDVADGCILFRQLRLKPLHFVGEALRQGLDRVPLRFLDELPLPRQYLLDRLEQFQLDRHVQVEMLTNPGAKFVECSRHLLMGDRGARLLGHVHSTSRANLTIKRRAGSDPA